MLTDWNAEKVNSFCAEMWEGKISLIAGTYINTHYKEFRNIKKWLVFEDKIFEREWNKINSVNHSHFDN